MNISSLIIDFVLAAVLSVLVVRSLKKDERYNFSTGKLIIVYIVSFIILSAITVGIGFLIRGFDFEF